METHELKVVRRARYFTLGDPATATELWVVLHGYGQRAAVFLAGFEPLVTSTRALVAPEALNRYYKDTPGSTGPHTDTPIGTTWMTREYREAEIADYVEYLDSLVRTVRPTGAQLKVLGFSQGVATASRWVALGGTQVDQLVLWAGSLPQDLDLGRLRDRLPAGGVDQVYGTEDALGPWIAVDASRARLVAAGIAVTVTTFTGGHRIDRDTLRNVVDR